jgi:hypothetical protein
MTWARDLTIDHYYVVPGYPNVCILREKINYQDESSKTFLKFEDSFSKNIVTMVVNQNEQFYSECGCVVSGGKKTRRKMKKRKPRKSRKARKSARGLKGRTPIYKNPIHAGLL